MADGDGEGGAAETVPKARLDQVIAARKALAAELAEAQARIATLEAAATEHASAKTAWESTVSELATLRATAAGWETEKTIIRAGVTDPEGIDFARHAWSRIPEAERPKEGIGAWLSGDRAKLPKAVAAYLPAVAAGGGGDAGAGAGGQGAGVNGQHVDPNVGGRAGGGAGADPFSGAAIGAMSQADFAAQRDAIWRSIGYAAPPLPKPTT